MGLHFCSRDKLVRKDGFYKRKLDFIIRVAVCHKMRPMGFSPLWLLCHLACVVTKSVCAAFIFQTYSPFLNLPLAEEIHRGAVLP